MTKTSRQAFFNATDARKAAFYFQCMSASASTYAQEREALASAGVSDRRIAALYPLDFCDIAPAIERHLLRRLPADFLHWEEEKWYLYAETVVQKELAGLSTEDQLRRHV